jgi:YD repeat-containing protein
MKVACPQGYVEAPDGNSCAKAIEANPTQAPASCKRPLFGNPIDPLTGSKTELVATGVEIGGMTLNLTYDSASKAPGSVSSAYSHQASFGELWFTNLHRKLIVSPTLKSALVSRGDGSIVSFTGDGIGNFSPSANQNVSLVTLAAAAGYRYSDPNGIQELYNNGGQLTRLVTAQGKVLTFNYSNDDLTAITDNQGKAIQLSYADASAADGTFQRRVTQITDATGRAIAASYDSAGNLTSLTWQDGRSRQFLYENASFAWALTGVIDENSSRYSTFGYDGQGRAISTEHAGGVERYSVSYGQGPAVTVVDSYDQATNVLTRTRGWQIPSIPVLTTPNGGTADMGVQSQFGLPALTSISQPAGSGCAAATSSMGYDANGNIARRDGFNGQRSCLTYDLSRNLPTVTVEGLANTVDCAGVLPANAALPAGSRKLSSQFHPDWSLATRTAQPLSLTTSVYNGQPDPFNGNTIASCAPSTSTTPDGKPIAVLCKQVVQTTADADGALGLAAAIDTGVAARISSFTYDAAGRMLSSVNPNGRITTYAYFTDTAVIGPYDTYFENVSLLLHANGSNGMASIVDASLSHRAVVANGNAQLTTTQSRFGGASMLFDGSGDYASLVHNSALEPNSDYTLEGWIRPSAVTGVRAIACKRPSVAFSGFQFLVNGGKLDLYVAGSGSVLNLVGSTAVAPDAYQHVAFVRSGNVFYLFLDGHLEGSGAISGNYVESSDALLFGRCQPNFSWDFNGAMDEIRVTKGVARYTANFTPPGQEFAESGPAADSVGHTTGDLQSVTNAAGHVTQFTLYDRAGRLRQMVGPKGMVTDILYTPRGWISSVTVTPPDDTATTTNYTYDNAGQLIAVSLPDGTTLGYSYDAAHRLTGVTDAKGNSVTYTLDNAGNKTGEQVKDPSGNLQRNITRVYDALNRVQQVTGASN